MGVERAVIENGGVGMILHAIFMEFEMNKKLRGLMPQSPPAKKKAKKVPPPAPKKK
jgi:hypothetical protein